MTVLKQSPHLQIVAIIMFGKDPGKFYPNTFVKIGRFQKNDADIKFQELEEGNLISLLPADLNLLNRKFLIKPMDFEGMHRIEKGEYPVAALREMMLNALVHRNSRAHQFKFAFMMTESAYGMKVSCLKD